LQLVADLRSTCSLLPPSAHGSAGSCDYRWNPMKFETRHHPNLFVITLSVAAGPQMGLFSCVEVANTAFSDNLGQPGIA
jgi:hypothetical protein